MKKFWLGIILVFLFAGCQKSEEQILKDELQDLGLSEEQSLNFSLYITSIYLGLVSFDVLDQNIEENSFDISVDDYNSVMQPFMTAAKTFDSFETSKKVFDFDDTLLSNNGPAGIMENMEKNRRNIGYMEKGITVGIFNNYTEDLISRLDISDEQKIKLYELYEKTVYRNNSFYDVNEDWKKARSK